jgi:hypothetical protein
MYGLDAIGSVLVGPLCPLAGHVAEEGRANVCEHNDGLWVAGMFNGHTLSVYVEQDIIAAVLHTVEGMLKPVER